MEITVRRALELKAQMKASLATAEQNLNRARSSVTFEENSDGVRVDVTDTGTPELMDALKYWEEINAKYLELECAILEHNSAYNVTYMVRRRKLEERKLKILEASLPKLVDRRVRATQYSRSDESVKFIVDRAMYEKRDVKEMIRDCKKQMRLCQESIDAADTRKITVSFEYEDLD